VKLKCKILNFETLVFCAKGNMPMAVLS